MNAKTSWIPKLRPEQHAKVVFDKKRRATVLVPTPLLVAEEIRRIRKGQTATPEEVRERLAKRYGADVTSSVNVGSYLTIIAAAAEEQLAAGDKPVAPYWRVVTRDGKLIAKRPVGPERQATHLRREGWRLTGAGARLTVEAKR